MHKLLSLLFATSAVFAAEPPAGFTALYNGKDLTGWRGGDTADHRKLLEMPDDKRAEQLTKWTDDMKQHWQAAGEELLNDGHGKYCTTEKEYGDFELLVDYNMAPKGDSGIYLRNVPQVQIWDPTDDDGGKLGRTKGSGGLWNNRAGKPTARRSSGAISSSARSPVMRRTRSSRPKAATVSPLRGMARPSVAGPARWRITRSSMAPSAASIKRAARSTGTRN